MHRRRFLSGGKFLDRQWGEDPEEGRCEEQKLRKIDGLVLVTQPVGGLLDSTSSGAQPVLTFCNPPLESCGIFQECRSGDGRILHITEGEIGIKSLPSVSHSRIIGLQNGPYWIFLWASGNSFSSGRLQGLYTQIIDYEQSAADKGGMEWFLLPDLDSHCGGRKCLHPDMAHNRKQKAVYGDKQCLVAGKFSES